MKKLTLLAVAALLMAAPSFAESKDKFVRSSVSQEIKNNPNAAKNIQAVSLLRSATSAEELWKPSTETTFDNIDGSWEQGSTYTYRYDTKGNAIETVEEYDGSFYRTLTTFNENGEEVSVISEYKEEGDESFFPSERNDKTYDPIVTDLVTSQTSYIWDEVENNWVTGGGNLWKREVIRNDAQKVTNVNIHTFFDGKYEISEKTEITYNADGLADSYSYSQLTSDWDPTTNAVIMVWGTPSVYKDLVWDRTDGQIVKEFETLFLGNNRIKKATIFEGEEEIGQMEVVYEANSNNFECTITAAEEVIKHSYKETDTNGSYEEKISYIMEDMEMSEGMIVTFDSHGNLTEEVLFIEEEGERSLEGGMRCTYTYDGPHGELTEMVIMDMDYDTKEFIPFMKVVSSDFVNVAKGATAIEGVQAEAARKIFNIFGQEVKEASQPGFYIINGKKVVLK